MWTFSSEVSIPENLKEASQKAYQRLINRKDLGFFDLSLMEQSIQQSQELAEKLSGKKDIWVVGLGGSSLGTRALASALGWEGKSLHFIDNVDPVTIDKKLGSIKSLDEHLFIFVSKSGGTIEVLSLLDHCMQYFKNKNFTNHIVVITEDKKSPLRDFANSNDVPTLPVPNNIGGRFSVFTPVGLFPAACMGCDISHFYKGFQGVLENPQSVFEWSGFLLQSLSKGELDFYFFQYSDHMLNFAYWFQQLWSESLGKSKNRQGETAPTISSLIPLRGTSDQHSVLQQIAEGQKRKMIGFTRVENFERSSLHFESPVTGNEIMQGKGLGELLAANAEATQKSLSEMGLATFCLKSDQLTPQTMGYLMGLSMLVVGTLGEVMDLNAFDQPGVESGKRLARRVLQNSH